MPYLHFWFPTEICVQLMVRSDASSALLRSSWIGKDISSVGACEGTFWVRFCTLSSFLANSCHIFVYSQHARHTCNNAAIPLSPFYTLSTACAGTACAVFVAGEKMLRAACWSWMLQMKEVRRHLLACFLSIIREQKGLPPVRFCNTHFWLFVYPLQAFGLSAKRSKSTPGQIHPRGRSTQRRGGAFVEALLCRLHLRFLMTLHIYIYVYALKIH